MKFRCERDDLLQAVQFASRAISNRATLPVLAGLRVEAAEGGEVAVASTDLELTMATSLKAAVDEPGKVILPGRLFGEMMRSLSAGQVSVVAGSGEVEIDSGRGRFRVKALAVEDYPALVLDEEGMGAQGVRIEADASLLALALSQVVRSASTDESRQVLTGVLWEIAAGEVTLAATDSYRLAVRSFSVEGGPAEVEKVILPGRVLAEVARSLQGGAARRVEAVVGENLIVFKLAFEEGDEAPGEAVIGSRFIEGEFPNYRQLIPESYPNTLTVQRDLLLDVVKRVGLLAQNNMPVKLQLGAELEVSAHTPDVGEGQEVVDAEYAGEPLLIAFNPQFLQEGAAAVQGDRLTLQASDGLKPAILRGEGDTAFTYLLMPVRLS